MIKLINKLKEKIIELFSRKKFDDRFMDISVPLSMGIDAYKNNTQIKNAHSYDETSNEKIVFLKNSEKYIDILNFLKNSYRLIGFNIFFTIPNYNYYCSAILFDNNNNEIGFIFLNDTGNIVFCLNDDNYQTDEIIEQIIKYKDIKLDKKRQSYLGQFYF